MAKLFSYLSDSQWETIKELVNWTSPPQICIFLPLFFYHRLASFTLNPLYSPFAYFGVIP